MDAWSDDFLRTVCCKQLQEMMTVTMHDTFSVRSVAGRHVCVGFVCVQEKRKENEPQEFEV